MFSIKRERLKRELKGVDSYAEWKGLAMKLDSANGLDSWKRNDQSHEFDYREIRRRLDMFRILKTKMMFGFSKLLAKL